jgi:hypothetical protein
LLGATLKYAVAKASGEKYDISKWTYTWSSFSCCAVWTWEANKRPTRSLGGNQLELLNWFSPQLSSTLFVVMVVFVVPGMVVLVKWVWSWYLWMQEVFVVYLLFWGWSATESSLT